MARFQAAEPNGVAVQQLEGLVRTAVFKSANQVVAYLLQQAADRIDAVYQPKPGWQRKARAQLTVDCIFGFFTLERDYYYHPLKQQGHYPADAALGLEGSPQTRRWLSRDPLGEPGFQVLQRARGQPAAYGAMAAQGPGRWFNRDAPSGEHQTLYGFVQNSPANSFDILGLIARGGAMQMSCRQPCEDYRRTHYADMEPGDVPNGAIVCCGGVKFICTWGVDKEKNQRAKEIAQRCLRAHERIHLPNVACDECATGPTSVKWKKSGKAACEEEVQAYSVGKAGFEAALSECGTDQQCIDSVNAWIQHEDGQMKNYQNMCRRFK